MSFDQISKELYISEPIEEPLMVFSGEGSGEESKVGNEEKKKIFFFGQPGCLKHSPLRGNPTENHNNHKTTEGESTGNVKDKPAENNKSQASDDEDGNDLLEKISKVLGEETTKTLPLTPEKIISTPPTSSSTISLPDQKPASPKQTAATSKENKTTEVNCAARTSEIINDSQSNKDEKLENRNESKSIEEFKSELGSKSEEIKSKKEDLSANENESKCLLETIATPLDNVQSNNIEGSKSSTILKSIVPYDDDSTSSSQPDPEKEQQEVCVSDEKIPEAPQLNESASLQTDKDENLDAEPTHNVIESVKEDFKEYVEDRSNETVEKSDETVKTSEVAVELKEQLDNVESEIVKETETLIEESIRDNSSVVEECQEAVEKHVQALPVGSVVVTNYVDEHETTIDSPVVEEHQEVADDVNKQETPTAELEKNYENIEKNSLQDDDSIEPTKDQNESKPEEEICEIEEIEEQKPVQQVESPTDQPIETEKMETDHQTVTEIVIENIDMEVEVTSPVKDFVEDPVVQVSDETETVEDKEASIDSTNIISHDDEGEDEDTIPETKDIAEGSNESADEAKDEKSNQENLETPECSTNENLPSDSPVEHESIVETPTHVREADVEKEENIVEPFESEDELEIKPDQSCKAESTNEGNEDKPSKEDDEGEQIPEQQTSSTEEKENPSANILNNDGKLQHNQTVSEEINDDLLIPEPSQVGANEVEVHEYPCVKKIVYKCGNDEQEKSEMEIFSINENQSTSNVKELNKMSEEKIKEQPVVVKEKTPEDEDRLEANSLVENVAVVSNEELNFVESPTNQEEIKAIEEEKKIEETVLDSIPEPSAISNQLETLSKSIIEETENISSPEDFNDYQDNEVSANDSEESENEEQLKVNHKSVEPENEIKIESVCAIEQETPNEEFIDLKEPEKLIQEIPSVEEHANALDIDEEAVTVEDLSVVKANSLPKPEDEISVKVDEKLTQSESIEKVSSVEDVGEENEIAEKSQQFTKPTMTRKRKISERKSISESDSEGKNVTDTVSHDNTSEDEEVVLKKKPRMRGKTTTPRKIQPVRKSAAKKPVEEVAKVEPIEEVAKVEKTLETAQPSALEANETESKQTLQDLQFDYDGTEDIVANVAAIRTMICKEPKKETTSERSEDEESDKRFENRRSRKTKRGRTSKRNDADSSSDEDSMKQSSKVDSKRSKTLDDSKDQSSPKKKRDTGAKGMLKYIDTSLVIETTENEAPVRQSRRIAQQKIREETERRQMEEKMLKQMKMASEKKKKSGTDVTEDEAEVEEEQKESSGDDESFKDSRKKKKSKIKPSDKQWQTSSSHSEHSESEDYLEHVPSDPGSPLFKSDHEFSPESDDDDTTQVQPVKRARTAKKLEAVATSDDEDINPNHACQVCHKTDSPEWILLCDECDCGYHCSCLKPIIFLIPSGNWYCPLCCHKKLIDNLSNQLSQLDTLMYNIETAEIRRQRQKQAEISEQNILQERRKIRAEKEKENRRSPSEKKELNGSSESDDSSDVPLTDYFYKLRKRNQTAAPSYRFNEYDDLINSAIRHEMDEVKGAGNLGRGKDIATIIEADKEEKQQQDDENVTGAEQQPLKEEKKEDEESSGSDIVRPKKMMKRKKKSRKLNNLDVSSDEERVSDEDFKGTSSSSDSEVDEEDLSMSSVSESSLDLPSKKNKGRNIRSSTRNRSKRFDKRFINDGDTDSDDEPLVRAKRTKKKDSDEEEFDLNDDDDEEGSLAEEIDSEDLCDDTETDSSSENTWPKRKKKRVASYDIKPRKGPKKNDNEDKAFRAGISKKKVLKKSDKESEGSASENEKGRRKTRGKKLLYLIEDDLDSDESDGIKPGVKRPETPPEEREMFVKKQEEIKRMLAAKDTEAAKKLAAPTIQPINIQMEMPESPSIPFSNEPASLSTIPKNVIESAKALDTDYNRIKPIVMGSQARGNDESLQSNDMNEEELAKMMEEEDFAQHQLKLAGEAIAKKKLMELEAKEEEFAAFNKANREKEWPPVPPVESKKRSRKQKSSEKPSEEFAGFSKALPVSQSSPKILNPPSIPPLVSSTLAQQLTKHPMPMQPQPSIMANLMQQQLPFVSAPPNLTSDRPSVLSSFMTRPEMHQQLQKINQPMPPDVYNLKNQLLPSQPFDDTDEKRKGRRKKFTPLRTDLVEGNISKLAKLDPPSVIQSLMNPSTERIDDKHKVPRPDLPKLAVAAPPQIFNPATNPTPSVITRLLQPQQRPVPGPYPQGFTDVGQPVNDNPNIRMYPEELKNSSPNKSRGPMQQAPIGSLPQSSFGENPFVPRNLHPLYRGPSAAYGIPPHARLPPYPFHHLHPNLRPGLPGEYSAPYNIPPQFSYYAPPAHSRQPPQASAIPLNHGATQLVAGTEDISNSIRNANNSEEPSETSEFGGLVSYFSSQQELD